MKDQVEIPAKLLAEHIDNGIYNKAINDFNSIFVGNYSRNDDERFKHADDIEETHVSEGDW